MEHHPCPPISVVLVTHVLDTAVPFIEAISRTTDVASVVAIPYSASSTACGVVRERARLITPRSVEELHERVRHELGYVHANAPHPVVVQEIGGYCAPHLDELAARESFFGIVEDTKQGHWRYEERGPLPCPVLSIAESPLKALENYQVGRSVAFSVETILRRHFHLLCSELRIGILGFGGIGETTAEALRAVGAHVSVYDTCEIRLARAAMKGFDATDRETLIAQSDFVLGVSGSRSIRADDLQLMKPGAIVASASSKQIEIEIDGLDSWELVDVEPPVKTYASDGKSLRLLNDGMPINFLEQSILGAVLDLVYTELYMCIRELALGEREPGLGQLALDTQRRIADVWRTLHWGRVAA